MACNDKNCTCDTTRARLLSEARGARLEPTRPSREPGLIVVGGEVVDPATASTDTLMRAARAVREQFKDVVRRQREHLAKLFSDSTATDGFKIKVGANKVGAKEESHGA
jgi:hypothetical protein